MSGRLRFFLILYTAKTVGESTVFTNTAIIIDLTFIREAKENKGYSFCRVSF